jgi:Ca2+-binding RTX toxin-like protein
VARSYNAFLDALGDRESNGNYAAENSYGYLGKYQFGELALRDVGYYTYDGTSANDWKLAYWTGKDGVDNKSEFLANHSAQESAIREYMTLQWQYVKQAWAYEGQVLDGVKITVSGILAGAHLVGAGNLNKYLLSGGDTVPTDGYGVAVETYVKQFAGYKTPFSVSHGKAEKVAGGSDDDKLYGHGGKDTLLGSGGDDALKGGGGDDTLHGGGGGDLFRGGGGEDTFRFTSLRQSRPAPTTTPSATSAAGRTT